VRAGSNKFRAGTYHFQFTWSGGKPRGGLSITSTLADGVEDLKLDPVVATLFRHAPDRAGNTVFDNLKMFRLGTDDKSVVRFGHNRIHIPVRRCLRRDFGSRKRQQRDESAM
jgi:hypothetical protein